MEPKQLTAAIKKLKTAHKLGHKILKKLDTGGKKQHRVVGYKDAAKSVNEEEELEKPLSQSTARNYAMFTRRYSKDDLKELVAQCREHKHCPGFDVVVRLMAIRSKSKRRKFTLQVLKNRWEKVRLGQEMRRTSATKSFKKRHADSQLEHRKRGRKPKAIQEVKSLLGELQSDAVKWQRIYMILSEQRNPKKEDVVGLGAELSIGLMRDIKKLTEVFKGFYEYE